MEKLDAGIVSTTEERKRERIKSGRRFAVGVESRLVSISSDFRKGSSDIVTQFSPSRSMERDAKREGEGKENESSPTTTLKERRETTNRSNARWCLITFRASMLLFLSPSFHFPLCSWHGGASPLGLSRSGKSISSQIVVTCNSIPTGFPGEARWDGKSYNERWWN